MFIFKTKKQKEAERRDKEITRKIEEYNELRKAIYVRLLKNRSRYTLDGAWHWATLYADEYMRRRYED